VKLSNATFYLTLISGEPPLFAAFIDSKFFVYLPFMLIAIVLLYSAFEKLANHFHRGMQYV
jgi:hypothetical protein